MNLMHTLVRMAWAEVQSFVRIQHDLQSGPHIVKTTNCTPVLDCDRAGVPNKCDALQDSIYHQLQNCLGPACMYSSSRSSGRLMA